MREGGRDGGRRREKEGERVRRKGERERRRLEHKICTCYFAMSSCPVHAAYTVYTHTRLSTCSVHLYMYMYVRLGHSFLFQNQPVSPFHAVLRR